MLLYYVSELILRKLHLFLFQYLLFCTILYKPFLFLFCLLVSLFLTHHNMSEMKCKHCTWKKQPLHINHAYMYLLVSNSLLVFELLNISYSAYQKIYAMKIFTYFSTNFEIVCLRNSFNHSQPQTLKRDEDGGFLSKICDCWSGNKLRIHCYFLGIMKEIQINFCGKN